jgi:hypothetical protein
MRAKLAALTEVVDGLHVSSHLASLSQIATVTFTWYHETPWVKEQPIQPSDSMTYVAHVVQPSDSMTSQHA